MTESSHCPPELGLMVKSLGAVTTVNASCNDSRSFEISTMEAEGDDEDEDSTELLALASDAAAVSFARLNFCFVDAV